MALLTLLPAIVLSSLGMQIGSAPPGNHPPARMPEQTPPHCPPMAFSNETNYHQRRLALAEGAADEKAAEWVVKQAGTASAITQAGNYILSAVVSPPEGWYEAGSNGLAWRDPDPSAGGHLRLIVRDLGDGRVVPGLDVRATLVDAATGADSGSPVLLPYGWYPAINGYGENMAVPRSGSYRVRVEIAPPRYWRHDPYNGDRYTRPTTAILGPIVIDADALKSGPPASGVAPDQQLALAKAQGDAYSEALKEMLEEQATDGKIQPAVDYQIGCAIEYAEGHWEYNGRRFGYTSEGEMSAEKNSHVEVVVRDTATGRFLPALAVTSIVASDDGKKTIGTQSEPFMWHPWMFHYGQNYRVPRSGHYTISVRFDAPSWRRYGREAGKRFAGGGQMTFSHIEIKTGER